MRLDNKLFAAFLILILTGCSVTNDAQLPQTPEVSTEASVDVKKVIRDPISGKTSEYYYNLPPQPGANFVDTCGETIDYVDVELFTGKNNIPANFVNLHNDNTIQIRWDDFRDIIDAMGTPPAGQTASNGTVPNVKWCTGTFIAADLILTAGHCFDPGGPGIEGWRNGMHVTPHFLDNEGRVASYVQADDLALMMHVKVGYQADATNLDQLGRPIVNDAGAEYEIVELVEHWENGLDYAIARVNNNGDTPSIAVVRDSDLELSDEIAIIQHPRGQPKKIDVGSVSSFDGAKMYYNNLDTQGGTSGAGVLDENGDIRGVHYGGHCSFKPFPGNVANRIEILIDASATLDRIAIPVDEDEE